jgi:hypothetical protein
VAAIVFLPIIENDFLTYYNESFGIKIDYPSYWVIWPRGNGMLTFIAPVGISGLTINKINQSNLDLVLSKIYSFLMNSSNGVQIIESKDVPLYGGSFIAKSLIYLVKEKNNFFNVAEILAKENDKKFFKYHLFQTPAYLTHLHLL